MLSSMVPGVSSRSVYISELSGVDVASVRDYLAARGLDDEYIEWKYFDADFNAGRNRGYAAVRDGKLVGFIGLIPFSVSIAGHLIETAWTCDWSVDEAEANATAGLSLLKSAIRSCPQVFHIGGNAITHKIFSRLASHFDGEAVREYRLRLRLSSQIDRVASRVPAVGALRGIALGRVPLRPLRHRPGSRSLDVVPGVAHELAGAFAAQRRSTALYPVYDAAYVQWQVGRCPALECYSCRSDGGAAGLIWRSRAPSREWRMVLACPPEDAAGLPGVVRSLVRAAYELGADVVKVRAAAADAEAWLGGVLTPVGFHVSGRLPYFAFDAEARPGVDATMSGLSYLDVDEAGTGWP